MIYVALLRGINVGGNNMIKMADLKAAFENIGMTHVKTYINSGNVIFESHGKSKHELTEILERTLSETFSYTAKVLVKTVDEIDEVIKLAPKEWGNATNLRSNIGFLWDSHDGTKVANDIELQDGVDSIDSIKGAVYMTTPKALLTKSKFNKLVGTKLYKDMTVRTFNTVTKILSIMSENQHNPHN